VQKRNEHQPHPKGPDANRCSVVGLGVTYLTELVSPRCQKGWQGS
jgi:hypothetical protein